MNLEKYPFFTTKMLKAFENVPHPEVTVSRKTSLKKIEKGKYTVHENPLVYATVLVTPSYLSLRSALHFYQLTNQIPLKAQVMIKTRKQPLKDITFITQKQFFGFTRTSIQGFDLFIATKEKLLLDLVQHHYSTDELQQLISEPLSTATIIEYLKTINNLSLTKRVGYILRSQDIHAAFSDEIQQSKTYPKLHQNLPRKGHTDSKWRLIIND